VVPNIEKRDMVSVEWSGFLKVHASGEYIFTLHVNDGCRLWVD